ncbi:hypothetical protein [Methylopila sp. 73B]|uniref:hypothetical protein n=1 Tax=Methylopila sp. 73B TaxID=1120792 RepID=UPI00035D584F|nr:hypothetical protein [Methylopila sp. 73B]
MATLPVLVTEMAKVDGRDRPTIDHIARTIRETGYISTGKRGGGASHVSVAEAVNLLIALNGADTPKDAALAIDRFRSLQQMTEIGRGSPGSAQLDRYDDYPQAIQNVMDARTFGEALEGLIEGVPELLVALKLYVDKQYPGGNPAGMFRLALEARMVGVEVTFSRYFGLIEMFRTIGGQRVVDFEGRFYQDPDRLEQGFYGPKTADRRVSVSVSTKTLLTIWTTLKADTEAAASGGGED